MIDGQRESFVAILRVAFGLCAWLEASEFIPVGVLRCVGMQGTSAKVYLLQAYCIGGPLAVFCVIYLHLGVVSLWGALCVEFAVGSVCINYFAFYKMDFAKEVELIQAKMVVQEGIVEDGGRGEFPRRLTAALAEAETS